MADVEIQVDGDWWGSQDREEQEALLDHELTHIQVLEEANGVARKDKAGRPKIKCRPHDVDVGWFRIVAARNGQHSLERRQAASMMEEQGQYFWPEIITAPASKMGLKTT